MLFNCLNAFSQEIVPIDIKNAEIHEIMENLKWQCYTSTNNTFTFQFTINEKGEAINITLPKCPYDSICQVNHNLLSKINFQPTGDSLTKVSFTIYSTINAPSVPRDSTIIDEYKKELKRFKNVKGDLFKYIIEDGGIVIRPWHYETIACYSLSSYTTERKPFWRQGPKKRKKASPRGKK